MNTSTLPPQTHTPRSFFVGPTNFWRGRERRKGYRRFVAIVRKGNTEPIEFLMAAVFIANGLMWWAAKSDAVVRNPQLIGVAFVACGFAGILGLCTRGPATRCAYAMGGGWMRGYTGSLYLLHSWKDPTWTIHFIAAAAMGWVFVRVFCKHWQRRKA